MKHKFIILAIFLLIVSCSHGDYHDLGNGYSFCEKGIYKQDNNGIDTLVIPPIVLDFAFNEQYIEILQKYTPMLLDNDTIEIEKLMKCNQQIKKQGKTYWIIDKYDNSIYGPLDKRHFLYLIDSLNIQILLHHPG